MSAKDKMKRFREQEGSLKLRLNQQIVGIANHLTNMQYAHRRVETNARKAEGHLQMAIQISLKLRRLYKDHFPKI